jgi:hypothetical protein
MTPAKIYAGIAIDLGTNNQPLLKVCAQRIIPERESTTPPKLKHDSSTNNLIRHYRKMKEIA